MAGVTSFGFAVRNTNKAVNGEGMRGGVAGAQFFNTIDWLRNTQGIGKVSKYAQSVFDNVDKVSQKTLGVSNGATKLAGFTSWAVNPLLGVASGVRVLKDKENKDKALTEEFFAMGAMFGAERVAKIARTAADTAIQKGSLDGIVKNGALKKYGEKAITGIKGMSKGQKTALFVAAELLFIGVSIMAFDNGKKFGKFMSGRNEDNKNKQVDYKS